MNWVALLVSVPISFLVGEVVWYRWSVRRNIHRLGWTVTFLPVESLYRHKFMFYLERPWTQQGEDVVLNVWVATWNTNNLPLAAQRVEQTVADEDFEQFMADWESRDE